MIQQKLIELLAEYVVFGLTFKIILEVIRL